MENKGVNYFQATDLVAWYNMNRLIDQLLWKIAETGSGGSIDTSAFALKRDVNAVPLGKNIDLDRVTTSGMYKGNILDVLNFVPYLQVEQKEFELRVVEFLDVTQKQMIYQYLCFYGDVIYSRLGEVEEMLRGRVEWKRHYSSLDIANHFRYYDALLENKADKNVASTQDITVSKNGWTGKITATRTDVGLREIWFWLKAGKVDLNTDIVTLPELFRPKSYVTVTAVVTNTGRISTSLYIGPAGTLQVSGASTIGTGDDIQGVLVY